MNESLYKLYRQTRRLVKLMDECPREGNEPEVELSQDLKSGLILLDESQSQYKERYEREKSIQDSFTPEQIDFICYQIGDWYLEWKERIIVDLEKGTHKLGFAKEELKELICG